MRAVNEDNATHYCEGASGLSENDVWAVYDAQGIYLCRVCEDCERVKLAEFRPEILKGYNQADVDEPIEPEECAQ
tara:strand:+ start:454 stop:678 length:225 start_codon:yes stop_codon:yes gene_type:complete